MVEDLMHRKDRFIDAGGFCFVWSVVVAVAFKYSRDLGPREAVDVFMQCRKPKEEVVSGGFNFMSSSPSPVLEPAAFFRYFIRNVYTNMYELSNREARRIATLKSLRSEQHATLKRSPLHPLAGVAPHFAGVKKKRPASAFLDVFSGRKRDLVEQTRWDYLQRNMPMEEGEEGQEGGSAEGFEEGLANGEEIFNFLAAGSEAPEEDEEGEELFHAGKDAGQNAKVHTDLVQHAVQQEKDRIPYYQLVKKSRTRPNSFYHRTVNMMRTHGELLRVRELLKKMSSVESAQPEDSVADWNSSYDFPEVPAEILQEARLSLDEAVEAALLDSGKDFSPAAVVSRKLARKRLIDVLALQKKNLEGRLNAMIAFSNRLEAGRAKHVRLPAEQFYEKYYNGELLTSKLTE